MGFYDIDTAKVIKQSVPVRLRKIIRLAWLGVLLYGVQRVYELFMLFRADRMYWVSHNSQVCYMEAALNDLFDNELRRIYIADGAHFDPVYVFMDTEEHPVWLATDGELPLSEYDAPVYLPTDIETYDMGYQFIVYYPVGLVFDMARMRALVNKYRLPSKWNYDIVSFS